MTETLYSGSLLVAIAIAVGLVGILVPLLPGTLLIWAAIAVWAFVVGTTASWVVLGVVTAILGAGILVKYLWPARRMKAADVSGRTLAAQQRGVCQPSYGATTTATGLREQQRHRCQGSGGADAAAA